MLKTMKNYSFFNGKIVEFGQIKISPFDIGILRGYAVFDVMRTANGKPFLIKEHYSRLEKSAQKLKLKLPFSALAFEEKITKLIKLNKIKEATIRTVVTGGLSRDAFSMGEKPTVYITLEKLHAFPDEAVKKGAKVIVLENSLREPGAKATLNYIEAVGFQDMKNKCNAHEILYIKNGKVLECSTSNIFIVKNGKIITPKDGILCGTTRDLVIKLAGPEFKIEEKEISEKELFQADEMFLTATSKGVVPIVKVGNKKIAGGKIGPITKKLRGIYEEFLKNY
jgi:D-amino acid aminotransferase